MRPDIWVVVPALNEERLIEACLDSLAHQSDSDFGLVVVDNGSEDRTVAIVEAWMGDRRRSRTSLITEASKGTGAAADTGFRHAIGMGADWVARTDADCLVDADWIAAIRRRTKNAQMLGGKIRARLDDVRLTWLERAYLPLAVRSARVFGRVRPSNRGPQYLCPYVMCVGNNLAVESGTYVAAGGFPRTTMEGLPIPNDRALVNRVRQVSRGVRYAPDMIVYNSARRLRAYGLRRSIRWYAYHELDTGQYEVDVR